MTIARSMSASSSTRTMAVALCANPPAGSRDSPQPGRSGRSTVRVWLNRRPSGAKSADEPGCPWTSSAGTTGSGGVRPSSAVVRSSSLCAPVSTRTATYRTAAFGGLDAVPTSLVGRVVHRGGAFDADGKAETVDGAPTDGAQAVDLVGGDVDEVAGPDRA